MDRIEKQEIRKAAKVLKKASQIISGNHWTRGTIHRRKMTPKGPVEQWCAIGAIDKAARDIGYRSIDYLAREKLLKHIQKNGQYYSIPEWNDRQCRKQSQVIDAMKTVAANLLKEIAPAKKKIKAKVSAAASKYFFRNKTGPQKAQAAS